MHKTKWSGTASFVCTLFSVIAMASPVFAQVTFTPLASFDGSNGGDPEYMSLVQGLDGNFYGTTDGGGANSGGTVFSISPSGTLTTLYSFCAQTNCIDGEAPAAGLVLATDGNFYGTTSKGGAYGQGTIFRTSAAGVLTTLYSFCVQANCADGAQPYSGLVEGTDGNFYGTTYSGGAKNYGTVFKITSTGRLTSLYSFCALPQCLDEGNPIAGLIQGTDGNFYGTSSGLSVGYTGTFFKITASGRLTTLSHFPFDIGRFPYAPVVQASDGNFYGTTLEGGLSAPDGMVFRYSDYWVPFHYFCSQPNCADGSYPTAGLVQAADGNLYGTTTGGGANGAGTVFSITTGVPSTLTTLYSFCGTTGCLDGSGPTGGLVQGTDGSFYGTTASGGTSGYGTVFSLTTGLAPFIATLPTSGKVGSAVDVLGTGLTGATSVTFDGTAAAFTVVSASEITTNVPAGATTGTVQVTTPIGTLLTNIAFRVAPIILSFSPTSGPVGTAVAITGHTFTGATTVTFGGVNATSFQVNSDSKITATVPSGAKTGKISITTPGGTAVSKGIFTVK